MKKLSLLLLGLLLAFTATYAQTYKLQKVKRTFSGTVQKGFSRRDMGLYPATSQGNTNFFTALNAGCVSLTLNSGQVIPVSSGCSSGDTRPFCSRGPTVTNLTVNSPSSMLVQYDGDGLSSIDWKIEQSGTAVRSGNSGTLTTSTFTINLSSALSDGSYTLVLDGTICKTTDPAAARRTFTVSTTTTTPPPVTTTAYFRDGFGEGSVSQLMLSAPFTPNFSDASSNQYSSLPLGNQTMYIQNANIKFGIGKALGGAIKWLSIGNGENLVNTNADGYKGVFEGLPAPDGGRSGGWSMYGTPGHDFHDNGMSTSEYFDTGMNWVHGGSTYHDMSKITWYEKRNISGYGEVMYCRGVPRQWAIRNSYGQTVYHCWWWLEGNSVRYFSILENNRTDTQMIYQGRQQEAPFIFPIAKMWHHKVPVPGGIQTITPVPPVEGSGTDGVRWTDIYAASAHWFGAVNDNDIGIFNIPQFNSRFQGSISQAISGDEFSNATSYNNSAAMMQWADLPGTNVAFSGAFYAGSLTNFLNWYDNSGFTYTKFDWSFGQNQTAGWWSENGAAKFINNRYALNIGYGRPGDNGTPLEGQTVHFAALASPFGTWPASTIPTIYIKGTFPPNITSYVLKWKKCGMDNSPEYTKTFSVNNSGTEQTVAIPMSGVSNWDGQIANIRIQMADFLQPTSGSELFVPSYIGNINPNSASDWQALLTLAVGLGTGLKRRKNTLSVRQRRPKQQLRRPQLIP
ncbi:hypothetical protein [Spirosoma sp.]|uniref:hypothetical protein n=1 Tax=Spirosoma sp. TaxID=1899569 RepID=UPI002612BC5F|nr:hypothetical protein [Spirosoma sp.]MCX6216496.1 hypothetical protein [Spirosoma sp.]